MKTKLYKRSANGTILFWIIDSIIADTNHQFARHDIYFGVLGKFKQFQMLTANANKLEQEHNSYVKEKRKQGYKAIEDLYDNAYREFDNTNDLIHYLNTYLPKHNTNSNGEFIPMLCKTLKSNTPFTKHNYFGQWKINGERCIITMTKQNDMFEPYALHYRSREGVDWTNKLTFLSSIILPKLSKSLIEMMLDGNVGLDGELYIPGYNINEINSIIKNVEHPLHEKLQFWMYDLCIENMIATQRNIIMLDTFKPFVSNINFKDQHLNNKNQFVVLPTYNIYSYNEAILFRDNFINIGFEGLVIRASDKEYQFGGKRNDAMLKFKRIEDGLFEILDINASNKDDSIAIFTLRNDINDETFEVTLNTTKDNQKNYIDNKFSYIGKHMLVEYRERSGVKNVPFHAKGKDITK